MNKIRILKKMNNRNGLIFALLLGLGMSFVACSPGNGYRIKGIIEGHNGFPVDKASIIVPGCGETIAVNDTFSISCNAGNAPQTIEINAPGFAPSVRVINPIAGLDYSLFVPIGMKLGVTEQDVKGPGSLIRASTKGFAIDGDASLFQTDSGAAVQGKVSAYMAYWDCVLMDKAVKPFFGDMIGEDGKRLKVLPIVVGYVDLIQDGKAVGVRQGQVFNATLTAGDLSTTNINSWTGENRLYYFDQSRGVFVEKGYEPVNMTQFSMRFTADATGFWIWAKSMVQPTCVRIRLDFPNGRGTTGTQVDVNGKYITEQGVTSEDSSVCIEGEGGYVVDYIARAVNDHLLTVKRARLQFPVRVGSCETTCPGQVELTFKCLDDTDCLHGYRCDNGECRE